MSTVVVSAINYLILIGAVEVLPQLFGAVYVPVAVLKELAHARSPLAVRQFAAVPPA